jgi:hypothetical protein
VCTTPDKDTWELYYLPDDFSQARDLAAAHPEKLKELQDLFWQEAEKYKVLPLLGGFSVFFGILPPMPTITRQTFYGDVANIASGMIPRVYGHSYAIEADLRIPGGALRASSWPRPTRWAASRSGSTGTDCCTTVTR